MLMILVAGPNSTLVNDTKKMLGEHFKLKVVGDLPYFLGLEIAHSTQGIYLSQRKYTLQLLHDTGYMAAKQQPTPMDANISFNDTDGEPLPEPTMYRRLLGRLIYLTISRPDIAFAVNRLSQFMNKPRSPHLAAVHHLLQYLKNAPGQGILFPTSSSMQVQAYFDADWGSGTTTRKSTTGYCVYLGSALVTWKSKKQNTVARSSAEAEYRAMAAVTSELLWLKQLLSSSDTHLTSVRVYSDSNSAIQMATNASSTDRTKHIDIDCHFVRQHVHSSFLNLIHVSSSEQLADLLTKALPKSQFHTLTSKLGLHNIFSTT